MTATLAERERIKNEDIKGGTREENDAIASDLLSREGRLFSRLYAESIHSGNIKSIKTEEKRTSTSVQFSSAELTDQETGRL